MYKTITISGLIEFLSKSDWDGRKTDQNGSKKWSKMFEIGSKLKKNVYHAIIHPAKSGQIWPKSCFYH